MSDPIGLLTAIGTHPYPEWCLSDETKAEFLRIADALEHVLREVSEWQDKGRSGFSMPVLRGEALAAIEGLFATGEREPLTQGNQT